MRICAALDATPDEFLVGTARQRGERNLERCIRTAAGTGRKAAGTGEKLSLLAAGARSCRGEAGKPRRRPDIYSLFTKKTRIGLIYKV